MIQVDYISDLHLDFYIKHDGNYEKWESKTNTYLEKLLPESIGKILVVAGDISHYNTQSKWTLEYFANHYDKVLFVTGNHDYYLISHGQRKKYKENSMNREMELVGMVGLNPKIIFLYDFEVFEYEGYKFAGSTFWYPLTEFEAKSFFNSVSNDSKLIKGIDIGNLNYIQTKQYEELEKVDVIVTHVPPIMLNSHHKYGSSHCYLNQVKELKANHYVFGHCHEQQVYEKGGSNFYINAMGYPSEWVNHMPMMMYSREERKEFSEQWNKIKSFEI